MFRDLLMLASCGSVSYVWLCAVVAPVTHAARSVWRHYAVRAAWQALGLSVSAAVLWTAIVGALVVLLMILEPHAGLALLRSHLFWPGIGVGAALWVGQLVLTFREPRLGATFEAATALAIIALVDDQPETLAKVHQLYAAHAIMGAGGTAASNALFHVTA
jgi:hypothetical protein